MKQMGYVILRNAAAFAFALGIVTFNSRFLPILSHDFNILIAATTAAGIIADNAVRHSARAL